MRMKSTRAVDSRTGASGAAVTPVTDVAERGGATSLSRPDFDSEATASDSSAGGTSPKAKRTSRLFVVRESNEWDRLLFDAMRDQTYQPYRGDEQVDAVRRAGLLPMTAKGGFEVEVFGQVVDVPVTTLKHNRTQARLFCLAGDWHLWSMSSAASMDSEGVNDFTEILVDVVTQKRPAEVIVANFSRLIRSQDQGAKLQYCFANRVQVVRAGSIDFHLQGENEAVGKMMFQMFATVAAMERDWIVARLLTGKIAKWRRGEWPHGKGIVPFGYLLDPQTKALVADPSRREAVRSMLITLGGEQPARAKAMALAQAGVTTMGRSKRSGDRFSVSVVANAHSMLDSLYAWAPIWLIGEHVFRTTNPLTNMSELAGVPAMRASEDDLHGEFQMLCEVALPDGGWAEQGVLDAFQAAALDHTARRRADGRGNDVPLSPSILRDSVDSALHRQLLSGSEMRGIGRASKARRAHVRGAAHLPMFSGATWEDETGAYEIQVANRGMYRVLRLGDGQPCTALRSSAEPS